MPEAVCLNGVLVPAGQARVSVFDSGFTQGIGLFETMRAYDGIVFRLDAHLERLRRSAQTLGWSVVPELDELRRSVRKAVVAAGMASRVRLTVTTGSLRDAAGEAPKLTVVAAAAAGGTYPPELYATGVLVTVSKCRQSRSDPTVGHKTTSYFARLAALRDAHAAGALEALWFTDQSHLAEGSISSVFLVRDGELRTPPLDTPVLPGVTRAALIELAGELKLAVRQEPLTIDDLLSADEVLLTNSMMEIMPVVRVERAAIGTEKPGDVTARLAATYSQLIQRECASGEEPREQRAESQDEGRPEGDDRT